MIRKPGRFILLFGILLIVLFRPVIFSINKIAGNFGDVYLHYYPLKYIVAEHLIRGKIPLWNPYIFAGQPVLANPQSAVFYPLSLLYYFFPLHTAFNYFYILHFFAGGLFFYMLLAALGYSKAARYLGAFSFAFSSFLVYTVPAGHPAALSGYIWLPLIMLFIERLKKNTGMLMPFSLAAGLSFQFLSGHFQPVYTIMVLIAIHLAFHRFEYWKELCAAGIAAVLLCACQLIPTMELSHLIEKSFWPGLVQNYSLPLKNLINIIIPNYFGNMLDGNYVFQENASYFFERHGLYLGLVTAVLGLAGIYFTMKKNNFYPASILAAGIILSTGIYVKAGFLYQGLPGLSFIRVPARFYLLAVFALTILACTAWDSIRVNHKIKLLFLLVLVADIFIWDLKFVFAQDMSDFLKRGKSSEFTEPLYRIATQPDKLASNRSIMYHQYNINGYEAIFLENFVKYLGLQEKRALNATGLARIDLFSPLARGFSVGYFISDVRMPNSKFIADLGDGVEVQGYANALPRVFLARSVKVIPDSEVYDQIDYLQNTPNSPDKELLVGVLPRGACATTKSGSITSYDSGTDKIEASALVPEGGTLVFSEIYYPGWKAGAAGKTLKVYPGDKALRTVFLAPGKYDGTNKIYLYYRPVSFLFGLYLTLISIVAALGLMIFPRFLTFIGNIDMILFK
jgi:hypothetical protein